MWPRPCPHGSPTPSPPYPQRAPVTAARSAKPGPPGPARRGCENRLGRSPTITCTRCARPPNPCTTPRSSARPRWAARPSGWSQAGQGRPAAARRAPGLGCGPRAATRARRAAPRRGRERLRLRRAVARRAGACRASGSRTRPRMGETAAPGTSTYELTSRAAGRSDGAGTEQHDPGCRPARPGVETDATTAGPETPSISSSA